MEEISSSYLALILLLATVLLLGGGLCLFWLMVVRRLLYGKWNHYLADKPLISILLQSGRIPVVITTAAVCVDIMTTLLDVYLNVSYGSYVSSVIYIALLVAVCLFLILAAHHFSTYMIPLLVRPGMVQWRVHNIVRIVTNVVQGAVVIIAILVALPHFGIDITGLLALGGAGGLIVGFASKDALSNLFNCMTLYFDRPYEVGDHIICRGEDIEGVVQSLSWRTTHVRTFDKRMLYVPNSMFINSAIENRSRLTHRRLREVIGIRYADAGKMEEITGKVKEMLAAHPDIDNDAGVLVYFNAFGASSLDFFISAFTRRVDWNEFHALKHDILLNIVRIVEACDSDFAFPTRTVHMFSEPAANESPDR